MSSFEHGVTPSANPPPWAAQGPGHLGYGQQGPPQGSEPSGYGQGYPGQGVDGGYPAVGPGSSTGPEPYGTGQPGPGRAAGGRGPVGLGDIVVGAGGLLFFIASFLPWFSLDLGVALRCDELSNPEIRASCEAGFGASAPDISATAWDLILASAAAVIMILVAALAIGMGLRVISGMRTLRHVVAAAVLLVDVILLTLVAVFDFSSLGTAFAEDALGDLPGAGSAGVPGLSLGLGFWLAVAGLVVANVGMVVAQRVSRGPGQPGS